jgi:hypothetical protein
LGGRSKMIHNIINEINEIRNEKTTQILHILHKICIIPGGKRRSTLR